MSARHFSLVLVSFVAACGGGGGDSKTDAGTDAPAATIVAVDPCPGGEAATFMTLATAFSPVSASISQGQVVKFMTTTTHPVGPIAPTEATLAVPENQTKCFRFTSTGTFRFKCIVHGYAGMITVN